MSFSSPVGKGPQILLRLLANGRVCPLSDISTIGKNHMQCYSSVPLGARIRLETRTVSREDEKVIMDLLLNHVLRYCHTHEIVDTNSTHTTNRDYTFAQGWAQTADSLKPYLGDIVTASLPPSGGPKLAKQKPSAPENAIGSLTLVIWNTRVKSTRQKTNPASQTFSKDGDGRQVLRQLNNKTLWPASYYLKISRTEHYEGAEQMAKAIKWRPLMDYEPFKITIAFREEECLHCMVLMLPSCPFGKYNDKAEAGAPKDAPGLRDPLDDHPVTAPDVGEDDDQESLISTDSDPAANEDAPHLADAPRLTNAPASGEKVLQSIEEDPFADPEPITSSPTLAEEGPAEDFEEAASHANSTSTFNSFTSSLFGDSPPLAEFSETDITEEAAAKNEPGGNVSESSAKGSNSKRKTPSASEGPGETKRRKTDEEEGTTGEKTGEGSCGEEVEEGASGGEEGGGTAGGLLVREGRCCR